ncbi:hypothetical protein R1flu_000685 [Riccia fluitans]|uniref:Uncharacterized protein n=1 Tax=Riccia fluitans TaxID=41844 RepID=A0ABD1Y1K5_9MARC
MPDSSHISEAPRPVDEVVVETSRKGKEKVTKSSHLSDIAAEERRRFKIRVKASRLEMDPPLSISTGQTSVFLEEDLVHARREEVKLKAMIQALKRKKCEMNARVTLMERKDLYKLLEAKMEGF